MTNLPEQMHEPLRSDSRHPRNLPEQMHAPSTGTEVERAHFRNQAADTHTLDASDVRLPRLKVAQYMSKVVTRGLVPYGALYISESPEDMEPNALIKPGEGIGDLSEPLRFYVLDVEKGYSYNDPNDELGRTQDGSYPNLALVKGNDPRNVRRTYDYVCVVPTAPELPVKFLFHGAWGGQAAKQINMRLLLAKHSGNEGHTVPFKIQTQMAENPKGPYARAVIGVDMPGAAALVAEQELAIGFLDMVSTPSVDDLVDRQQEQEDADVRHAMDAPDDAPDLG